VQAEIGDYDAKRFSSFVDSHTLLPSNVTAIHFKQVLEQQVQNF